MEETQRQRQRKQWLEGLAALFLLIGCLYFVYWLFVGRFYESTDDAYVGGNLVEVMPQINGQVIQILADETDLVTKGQPVVVLDKADAEIGLKNAESRLAETVRQVAELYKRVAELQANLQMQQANFEKAKEAYQRRQGLVATKTISIEELRNSKLNLDSAIASLNSAQDQLAAALVLVGNTDLYHHPQVQQASIELRDAYLNWRRTVIYAPATGYVAKRPVNVGEHVTPSTVLMVIAPLNQIWVDANFKESQLRNIRIGQPATMTADAYGSSVVYHGKVVGLSPGTGSTFDLLPPQNATGNWIKIVQRLPVRIAVDPQQLMKYPLRLGLSMTVTINTYHRHGAVLMQVPQKKVIYQTQDFNEDVQAANQLIDKILQSNAANISYSPPPTSE